MKFLSDHNVNIYMRPIPPKDMLVQMEFWINGKKYAWANIISNLRHCRFSISHWFSIAAKEIKEIYGLNS